MTTLTPQAAEDANATGWATFMIGRRFNDAQLEACAVEKYGHSELTTHFIAGYRHAQRAEAALDGVAAATRAANKQRYRARTK